MSQRVLRPRILLAPALVALLWLGLSVLPARSMANRAHSRIDDADREVEYALIERAALRTFETQEVATDERLAQIERAIPGSLDLGRFVTHLQGLAARTGLDIEVVSPDAVSDSSTVDGNDPLPMGVSAVAITLAATGSYDEITDFVALLETDERLLLVDLLSISTVAEDPDILSLDLGFRIFTTQPLLVSDPFEEDLFDEELFDEDGLDEETTGVLPTGLLEGSP